MVLKNGAKNTIFTKDMKNVDFCLFFNHFIIIYFKLENAGGFSNSRFRTNLFRLNQGHAYDDDNFKRKNPTNHIPVQILKKIEKKKQLSKTIFYRI